MHLMEKIRIESVDVRRKTVPYEIVRIIARGTETHARMVEVQLGARGQIGRGEAHASMRYGETDEGVVSAVERVQQNLKDGCGRLELLDLMPPGPARNAVDCALWDLEAKLTGKLADTTAGVDPIHSVTTVYTISLNSPEEMAAVAKQQQGRPLLKVKLGHFADDRARLEAVRRAAPAAQLIVDANEGWNFSQLKRMAPIAHDLGVVLLEQPLHAHRDAELVHYESPVTLCADESCHTRESLDVVATRYDYVNIKLDKTGGLTEALALARAAQAKGLGVMVGCMSGSTLSVAPGFLLAQICSFVDLDSPMYLPAEARPEVDYHGSRIDWSSWRKWGMPG
jgi:L-alanine-DL-glutamate epimerase-like enolase superfamily enzyme